MLRLRIIAALLACALSACTTINLPPQQTTAAVESERFGSFTDKDARNALITLQSSALSDGSHVPWQSPFYIHNPTFWVDGDSNSDVNSTSLDARGAHVAWFKIEMTNGSTPVGNFSIQVSDDGTNDWEELYIDANRVYAANIGAFSGGTTIAVSSPAGAVLIYVAIENPPGYLRVLYDRTSGGAADTIDATSFVRGG